MDNEYLTYLKEDARLYAVVCDKLPDLKGLSASQIEKLVFYLKSLHSYYPKSENHADFYSEFSDKLDKLRNGTEQIALQRRTTNILLKGIASCVLAGFLLAISLATLLGDQIWIAAGFFCASIGLILFADSKLLYKALLLSKEQDRKYFLSSIRTAKACNELDWAGLFSCSQAFKTGSLSITDEEYLRNEVYELTAKLRAALYNDKYFQYSLDDQEGH